MRLNLGILRYGWLMVGSLFVACDDTTDPGRRLTDTYVLQYVNGDPLPFTIDLEYIMPQALLAEELDFRSSGEVIRVRTMRHSRRERGDTTEAVVMHHEYQVRGSEIEIGTFVDCPDTADCLPNDYGTLTADGLELQAYSLPFVEPLLLTYEKH